MVTPTSAVKVSLDELIHLNQAAHKLALHNKAIRANQSGNYLSHFKGRGMEFDEARLYMPGDDVRMLDWRLTARTGKPHTKLYREERERPVLIAVDYRASMFFATRGVFKSVLAARIASLISWSAHHHSDRIGGQVFTDYTCQELKPQTGRQAVLHLLKQLTDYVPEQRDRNTMLPKPPLQHALSRLCRHARPGSQVFIISDFRGLDQTAEHYLMRLSRHCEVGLIFIYDPLEKQLPQQGRYRLSDGGTEVVIDTADQQQVHRYQQKFAKHQQRLRTLTVQYGISWIACCTMDNAVQILSNRVQGQAA